MRSEGDSTAGVKPKLLISRQGWLAEGNERMDHWNGRASALFSACVDYAFLTAASWFFSKCLPFFAAALFSLVRSSSEPQGFRDKHRPFSSGPLHGALNRCRPDWRMPFIS